VWPVAVFSLREAGMIAWANSSGSWASSRAMRRASSRVSKFAPVAPAWLAFEIDIGQGLPDGVIGAAAEHEVVDAHGRI